MPTPVEDLINEVRVLYQTLVQVGEGLHEGSQISMGMRAVLEYLDREGDTTVPNIARSRSVSRQRIQSLVNALQAREFVTTAENPASQRSPLISLTNNGKQQITQMRKKEGQIWHLEIPERNIKQATATLRKIKNSLRAEN